MNRLIKILFLSLIAVNGFSQTPATDSKLIGPLPSYRGYDANIKIAFLQSISADAKQTRAKTGFLNKKYPLVISMHGIGVRTSSYATMASMGTADLPDLYLEAGLPAMVRYTNSSLYNKRFAAPGTTDSTSFLYLFPQGWGGYTEFWPTYVYYMIQYAKDSLGDILDPTRIYLTGLSWGGGACMLALQDTTILKDLAACVAIAMGYNKVPRYPANFKAMADWGGFLRLAHSLNDSATARNPITKAGCYLSDQANDSLLKWKGITIWTYDRWVNGGHNGVWNRIYSIANASTDWGKTNGQTVNYLLNMHSQFLMFSTKGRRKVVP